MNHEDELFIKVLIYILLQTYLCEDYPVRMYIL